MKRLKAVFALIALALVVSGAGPMTRPNSTVTNEGERSFRRSRQGEYSVASNALSRVALNASYLPQLATVSIPDSEDYPPERDPVQHDEGVIFASSRPVRAPRNKTPKVHGTIRVKADDNSNPTSQGNQCKGLPPIKVKIDGISKLKVGESGILTISAAIDPSWADDAMAHETWGLFTELGDGGLDAHLQSEREVSVGVGRTAVWKWEVTATSEGVHEITASAYRAYPGATGQNSSAVGQGKGSIEVHAADFSIQNIYAFVHDHWEIFSGSATLLFIILASIIVYRNPRIAVVIDIFQAIRKGESVVELLKKNRTSTESFASTSSIEVPERKEADRPRSTNISAGSARKGYWACGRDPYDRMVIEAVGGRWNDRSRSYMLTREEYERLIKFRDGGF